MNERLRDKLRKRNEDVEIPDWVEGLSHAERIELVRQGYEGLMEEGALTEEEAAELRAYIRRLEAH